MTNFEKGKKAIKDSGYDLNSLDLTVWNTDEGMVRMRENYCGESFYLDINNKYDHACNTKDEAIAYLGSINAEFNGWDSENDW